ncbi:MAG: hypothetical protein K9N46_06580 [Candidatus Marinimicrobia bacterium]|nr:hypothetical protein [Candidatus Neomarinimicrobiota bacterium]MCF7828645.1 hypothetical protein [Candidatus Neomarinimicrobiota bacterium]MCF7880386.1 hypothetical protein [Candidatus Neomarinimicrobiota bacterium]
MPGLPHAFKYVILALAISAFSGLWLYNSAVIAAQEGSTESGLQCNECHSASGWTPLSSSRTFSHATTAFPLEGRHASVSCRECHTGSSYEELHDFQSAESECMGCHIDVHEGQLGADCESCHRPTTWIAARTSFNHDGTRFPLIGAHKAVDCQSCHDLSDPLSIANVPLDCYGCHESDYQVTVDPDHAANGFPTDCEMCHDINATAWRQSNFDHDLTAFPLVGTHEQVLCADCHGGRDFSTSGRQCISCHQEEYALAEVSHQNAEFGTNCTECHSVSQWTVVTWNHLAKTEYLLEGEHVSASCLDCHIGNNYDIGERCAECHDPTDYIDIVDHQLAFETFDECEDCHPGPEAWSPSTWDHNTETDFMLTGSHVSETCLSCHAGNTFGIQSTCYSCHQTEYESTTGSEFDHPAQSIPVSCETCHNTTSWSDATFDHDQTDFPLTGAHTSLACINCHDGTWIDYSPPPGTTCYTCHQQDYEDEPIHTEQGFGTNCLECHTTSTFEGAEFDHIAYFPIYTGTHQGRWDNCSTCHTDPEDRTVFTCITGGCHDNETELNQEHQEEGVSGYTYQSDACYACHPTGESDDSFDHTATGFPLDGQHLPLQCNACHINNDFQTPLNSECTACHTDTYNQTSNPSHSDSGFSDLCESCHSTAGFLPADWSHADETGFALSGTHASQGCNDCHATSEWSGYQVVSVTCATCHQDDYDATISPNHADAGFSIACTDCHSSFSQWPGATFDHDSQYFPIYSGEHRNEWTTCTAECHIDESNYANFSCGLNGICHEHDQNEMIDEHDEEPGFVYDSRECYSCHPNGTEDDGDDDIRNTPRKFIPKRKIPRAD